jgi:hypothetical protein
VKYHIVLLGELAMHVSRSKIKGVLLGFGGVPLQLIARSQHAEFAAGRLLVLHRIGQVPEVALCRKADGQVSGQGTQSLARGRSRLALDYQRSRKNESCNQN